MRCYLLEQEKLAALIKRLLQSTTHPLLHINPDFTRQLTMDDVAI